MTGATLIPERPSAVRAQTDEEARRMVRCLEDALAGGDDLRRSRIARARTTVQMLVVDPTTGEEQGPVLVCDRPEPTLRCGREPAEITIRLSREQARRFCRGELNLSNSLVSGEVRATGPARKFLVIEPILRSLIAARVSEGRVG